MKHDSQQTKEDFNHDLLEKLVKKLEEKTTDLEEHYQDMNVQK